MSQNAFMLIYTFTLKRYTVDKSICHQYICGEKSVMWRNFRFLNMTDVEKFEVSPQVEQFQIYPHGEILNFSTYGMCVMCKIDAVLL